MPVIDLMSQSRQFRSGNSEILGEQKHAATEIWAQPITKAISHLLNSFIELRADEPLYYLSPMEQRVMKSALRRSVRIIHKA
jgi:hypothetical protein